MNQRYMLIHKLHFIKVYTFFSDNMLNKPKIYVGKNLLQQLNINNSISKNLHWHYWSKDNLHRYSNIDIDELSINIAYKYNILNIDNSILAVNFCRKNIISQNLITDIAVIASFKYLNPQEILNTTAKILLFDYQHYNNKLGNVIKSYKAGVNMYEYIDMCYLYSINKDIVTINKLIYEINNNSCKKYIPRFDNNYYIDYLKNYNSKNILQGTLTECILDYEGSTGIDFDILYNSRILPQEMVYFYHDYQRIKNMNEPVCTYTILEKANSKIWSANGGISHHLTKYVNNIKLNVSTNSNSLLNEKNNLIINGINQI